jgi:hypothetical protein
VPQNGSVMLPEHPGRYRRTSLIHSELPIHSRDVKARSGTPLRFVLARLRRP